MNYDLALFLLITQLSHLVFLMATGKTHFGLLSCLALYIVVYLLALSFKMGSYWRF